MVMIKTNAELDAEEREGIIKEREAEATAMELNKPNMTFLGILHKRFGDSIRAKRNIEEQFFKNKDQSTGVYEAKKLAAIRETGGAEVFVGITETKNRHAKSWVRDALFQPGQNCWGVDPTPSPEVPQELMDAVQRKFVSQTMAEINTTSQAAGVVPDYQKAIAEIQGTLPELQNAIKSEMKGVVFDKCEEMSKEIDDVLVEGGWYEALDETVPDMIEYGTGILLGPLKRKKPVLAIGENGSVAVEYKVVREFERVSPFDVYPQPDSCGPQDGWVFVRLSYRKTDLQYMLEVPGFNNEEIEAILAEAKNGNLREWTNIEVERAYRDKKTSDPSAVYDSDKIDCILYMGSMNGEQLIEAGLEIEPGKENHDHEVTAWFVKDHVIKVMINEDPLGRHPISAGHFEENIDGWWGKGLPELIEAEQQVCNACARAVVNNVAMGSGPQVEINIDRLRGGALGDTRLIPWKKWLTTNRMQQTGQAINFWQAQMHAGEIIEVFNNFKKGADERSNIPAYAHGDSQVGGAGNTASGLSMLISQASRGIRGIIRSIDLKLIIPSITYVYETLALSDRYRDKIGDVRLVAKGSQALLEKEQRTVRMLEFLNSTNNPVDQQIMGAEGRGYVLSEIAKSYEIDPAKALPRLQAMKGQVLGQPAPQTPPGAQPGVAGMVNRGTPPAATENVGLAGEVPQGGAAQLFTGRGGPAALPKEGE